MTITGTPSLPIAVGIKVFLTATVGATGYLSEPRVIWRTSAPSVVQIDEFGLASAVGPGVATIEAIAKADTTKRGSATITAVAAVGNGLRF